jgi:hypothetical protein
MDALAALYEENAKVALVLAKHLPTSPRARIGSMLPGDGSRLQRRAET